MTSPRRPALTDLPPQTVSPAQQHLHDINALIDDFANVLGISDSTQSPTIQGRTLTLDTFERESEPGDTLSNAGLDKLIAKLGEDSDTESDQRPEKNPQ